MWLGLLFAVGTVATTRAATASTAEVKLRGEDEQAVFEESVAGLEAVACGPGCGP